MEGRQAEWPFMGVCGAFRSGANRRLRWSVDLNKVKFKAFIEDYSTTWLFTWVNNDMAIKKYTLLGPKNLLF